MKKAGLWFMFALFAAGCRDNPPKKNEGKAMAQPAIVKAIPVKGFDPDGEPEIRVMSDGTMFVVFNFIPPSWDEDEAMCADFDKQLAKAIGLPVQWEDRELFLIQKPVNDTAERVRAFLEAYRKNVQR